MRPEPALLALAPLRFRVAVRTRPQHRHKHLRGALRVPHRHRRPGVVYKQLLACLVPLQHRRRPPRLPRPTSGTARSTHCTRTRPGAPRGTPATTAATSGFCAGSTLCASSRSPAPPAQRPYSRPCKPAESKSAGNGRRRPASSAGCSMRLTGPSSSRSRVASGRTRAGSAAPLQSRSSQSSSSASRTPSREGSAPWARCRNAPEPAR